MRILLASSEVHPFSKTGGLADMVAALAKSLASRGHTVGLISPLYRGIREKFPKLKKMTEGLYLPMGATAEAGQVWHMKGSAGEHLYFIEHDGYFNRSSYYLEAGRDFVDNDARFIFLSKAVVHLARHLPWKPEFVHVHDWQVGFVPLLIKAQADAGVWPSAPPTLLTIHNLAYQGVFPATSYPLTNLPWSYYNVGGVEYYNQISCLKAGINFATQLTTVSPRYAREITTPEFGCGLDGVLRARVADLTGVLNGVDYDEWNTTDNKSLAAPFDLDHMGGKAVNKAALQAAYQLPVRADVPVFASVSRLADQKGFDLTIGALEEMLSTDMQFVMLGTGEPELEDAARLLAQRFPDKVGVKVGYDHKLAHLIEAGSDFFLMPSKFEPCGLNQMYSLRYGSIPIVRATGGLDDSVIDATEDPKQVNGIKFREYTATALAKAIRKGLGIFAEPKLLEFYRWNGMGRDFSWAQTSAEYEALFKRALSISASARE